VKKFSRILIANRGEIALRILRACRELGIESVIVHSVADSGAGYLDLADRTVCIGPGPSQQSYLDISRIIAAAEVEDVDAIHPGYGFLAENVQFAEICKSSHIEFIGPGVEAIAFLGDKGKARELAREVGVPCVPGSTGILENEDEALKVAQEIGVTADNWPILKRTIHTSSLHPQVSLDVLAGTQDTAGSSKELGPEEVLQQADLLARLGQLLEVIDEREATILRLRYGLGGEEEHTLEQIGQSLSLSRERVRQLEARALKKLRETIPAQSLHPILEP
jgi:RNA polymerase sigma factor (sigma-70 family)